MMALARCVALFAVAASADTEVIAELGAFDSASGYVIDDGGGIFGNAGAFGSLSLSKSSDSLDGSSLRADYEVRWEPRYQYSSRLQLWLNHPVSHFDCRGATHLELRYKVLAAPANKGDVFIGVALLDSSECEGHTCGGQLGFGNEIFYKHWLGLEYDGLDDTSGRWRTVRQPLCGNLDPHAPFWNPWLLSQRGNGVLDPEFIQGWWLQIHTASGRGASEGSVLLDRLACVRDPGVAPAAPGDCRLSRGGENAAFVPGAQLAVARVDRVDDAWTVCYELCERDPDCRYYMNNVQQVGGAGCWLASSAENAQFLPPSLAADFETYWMTSPERRGRLCDVCACDGAGAADCRDRGLLTVPAPSDGFSPRSLDLGGNPIGLLGPEALDGFPDLETLVLPSATAHVAAEALGPGLRSVSFAGPAPRTWLAPADSSTSFFQDVCCGRGDAAAGLAKCVYEERSPGRDCTYEDYVQCLGGAEVLGGRRDARTRYIGPEPLMPPLTRASEFLAEASESQEKCGAVCEILDECRSFTYNRRLVFDDPQCLLYPVEPQNIQFNDQQTVGEIPRRTSGTPPRTRARLDGARVVAGPAVLELSEATAYAGTLAVALGADPLRGAVWVTPGVADGRLNVTFEPTRVALYDSSAGASVEVTVGNPRSVVVPVTWDIEACDAAFETTDFLDVSLSVTGPGDSSSNKRAARRIRRRVVVAAIVVAACLGALLLAWSLVRIRQTALKKRALEAERSIVVQAQTIAAQERVREFQAYFCVLRGQHFVGLKKLRLHERLREYLTVYDSVADVRKDMEEGLVFVFLSHQWLGYTHPDPNNVQYESMVTAVHSVAAAADVPLSKVRVWLDVISIPQKNRAEQRLAIASLPTFASCCQYFVVVAPSTVHAATKNVCNADSYRSRAWCRAEIMSCWARNGLNEMYISTEEGLRPLAADDEVLTEALDVFGGDLTCCRLGHRDSEPCDRESLMLPMLGLYAEIYRDRKGVGAEAYAVIEPLKEKLYPKTFAYKLREGGGPSSNTETSVLFGDLIEATELAVDLAQAPKTDLIWRRATPDFAPGTNAQKKVLARSHHSTRHLTLSKSFQTPMPSFAEASSADATPGVRRSRPDASQPRPGLLRARTWRTQRSVSDVPDTGSDVLALSQSTSSRV